ncbi:RES family NAD+ phosphorylase [Cupriavidus sp. UGS-1]|uniref:RES family NAD+ phosphorylase n=1 Tax=Cupriavidus sp. UGS-1 TaxID=2899826 RepID=UPI001E3079D3|nr:RES family NAD+ phosphorylase [Cupriavidus sp. UGS-1]MCD9121692.1 RES family NAD+ phosphorylase [Cupriavidus sp. UGS-1]
MSAFTAEELDCPLPPADLAERSMPEIELDLGKTPLWRIHRSIFGPIHYTRKSLGGIPYRFDAANDEFGVLYASPSFAACMAEGVIRDRLQGKLLPLLLDEAELSTRSIAALAIGRSQPLRLADLTKPHLHLGMDNRVLTTTDYRGPNLWSSAIYKAYPHIEGIYFTSRFANEPSVAVFDRVRLIQRGDSIPLLRFHMLPEFLDRNGIGLAPPSSPWDE